LIPAVVTDFENKKMAGREADNSPPSTIESTKAWSYNSTPQYAFVA